MKVKVRPCDCVVQTTNTSKVDVIKANSLLFLEDDIVLH